MDRPSLNNKIAEIARALLGAPNEDLSSPFQWRYGTRGSIAIEIAGPKRGAYFNHETSDHGGPWELLQYEGGLEGEDALQWLRDHKISTRATFNIVAEYDYRGAALPGRS